MVQTAAGTARPRVSIVAAVARNRVIGRDNAMPWHIPGELARFRQLTMGHTIIMGRRTHESIGRPLPGRRNLVVSRDPGFAAAGCEVVSSLQAAISACADAAEVFVIGGAQIYAMAIAVADRLHLTEIQSDFPGDTWFPDYDAAAWRELARERHLAPEGFNYDYVTYVRATPQPQT
jgi:dihydrofolate reductase